MAAAISKRKFQKLKFIFQFVLANPMLQPFLTDRQLFFQQRCRSNSRRISIPVSLVIIIIIFFFFFYPNKNSKTLNLFSFFFCPNQSNSGTIPMIIICFHHHHHHHLHLHLHHHCHCPISKARRDWIVHRSLNSFTFLFTLFIQRKEDKAKSKVVVYMVCNKRHAERKKI